MAIKDRPRRRLPRLGVIRLGHKEKKTYPNGKTVEYPVQDDHFVLTDAPEVEAFYGAEPRELDVWLPFPDVERNFDANYQVWAGGVLICQGDGEYVSYATPFIVDVDSKGTHVRNAPGDTPVASGVAQVPFEWNGTRFEAGEYVPCSGAKKNLYPHCAACRLNGILKVMMAKPELFRFGYYQISTGSGRNYDTIMGTLEAVPAARLNGIPFKLRLVQEQTTFQDKDGKRRKSKKWFLQLEPDPELTRKLYKRAVAGLVEEPQAPVIALPVEAGPDRDGYEAEPEAPPPHAEVQKSGEEIVVEEVVVEDEPEPRPEPHWIDRIDKSGQPIRGRFWAWTGQKGLGLTKDQVYEALGVEYVRDFTGTMGEAKERITAWIDAQIEAHEFSEANSGVPF